MKRVRPVSLAAAMVVTANPWAAHYTPVLYTQSVPAVGTIVAGDMSDAELPQIVVGAFHQQF